MPRISHVVGTKTYWFADLRDLLAKARLPARATISPVLLQAAPKNASPRKWRWPTCPCAPS